MLKLSVVIITLNEERNIKRCLDSVKDIADDIVVVDSYSSDKTREICETASARFMYNKFEGHIEQKNFAVSQAKYHHILSLDADEYLSSELKNSILEVKQNWTHDGYYFNRLTNYCGRWIKFTSWYPSKKLRLWDSRKGKWGGLNPHDRFILQKGAKTKFLKGNLLHHSYYNISEHVAQTNYFSGLVAEEYYKAGRKAGYFRVIFNPLWRLFRDYFLRLGFLEGFYGLAICVNSAHETFLKYAKLRILVQEDKKRTRNRICFFNSVKAWGGGEKWHFDMAGRLYNRGHDVLVITNKHSELNSRLAYTEIPVETFRISNLSFLNPVKVLRLAMALRKNRVGTIILNMSIDLKVAGLASRIAGIRRVIYRRGSAIPIRNIFLNRLIFKYLTDEIIANSEETKATILSRNPALFNPDKIKVIYNGIDLDLYQMVNHHEKHSRENNELIIGNAGRLVKQKGQLYLIEVASLLKSRGIKFKMLIAGEGKLQNELQKQVMEKNLGNEIQFVGFIEDIRSFMESTDIFVLTSLWEGFGYVLVEAMACCKPVVAFEISSNPEIIDDKVTGFLVKPFDVEAFADKIMLLLQDADLRTQMGLHGRKRVEDLFTIEKTADNLERLLSKKKQLYG